MSCFVFSWARAFAPAAGRGALFIGMVEVPVGIDDVFHRRVIDAVERLFEFRPSRRNESVHDEFAVWAAEDYHASAGAGEHSEIVSELLRLDGSGVELGAHTRD